MWPTPKTSKLLKSYYFLENILCLSLYIWYGLAVSSVTTWTIIWASFPAHVLSKHSSSWTSISDEQSWIMLNPRSFEVRWLNSFGGLLSGVNLLKVILNIMFLFMGKKVLRLKRNKEIIKELVWNGNHVRCRTAGSLSQEYPRRHSPEATYFC